MSEYLSPQEEFVKSLPNLRTTDEFKDFLDTVIKTQERAEEIREDYPTIMPGVPLIFGKPGMGKSSIVEEFAKENGYLLVEVNASRDIDERFRGIPYPLEKKGRKKGEEPVEMVWVSSEVLNSLWKAYNEMEERKKKGENLKGIILFIDDMHYAAEDLAPILHELLTNKKIAGRPLPPHTYIILASNYGDATNAQSIASTIMTRVLPVRFEPPDREAYLNYERFAREVMAGRYHAVSLTALEFFDYYKEIFTQKEEADKMTGTVRTVNYLLMTLKTLEDALERGEISPDNFRERVSKIVGYLPSEYQDKFLQFYFTVRDLNIAQYIEEGKKVNPYKIVESVKKILEEKGLSPEEEPINLYVRANVTQYIRNLLDNYVMDMREAVKEGEGSVEKVLRKYLEKFHKIGEFYNTIYEASQKAQGEDEIILKKISAGIWDSLTTSGLSEMKNKANLALHIFAYASPDHPDKKMLSQATKMILDITEKNPDLNEALDVSGTLDEIRNIRMKDYIPGMVTQVFFSPLLNFLFEVKLLRNGKYTTVGETVGSEIMSELTLANRDKINQDFVKMDTKEETEEMKKLRNKYNSMRL